MLKKFFSVMNWYPNPYRKYLALSVVIIFVTQSMNVFSLALLIPIINILFKKDQPMSEFTGTIIIVVLWFGDYPILHGSTLFTLTFIFFMVILYNIINLLKDMSTFKNSDEIFMLYGGGYVEAGQHKEFIVNTVYYKRLNYM